jgi:rare lipoprotein A (peptidoglycan hydrolase)
MFALGEWLKVVNMENGRQVVVIVTDRHDNLTDIDLSFQAYATLRDYDGTTDSGNIPVRIERVVQ